MRYIPGSFVVTVRVALVGLLPNTVFTTIDMLYEVADSKLPMEYCVDAVLMVCIHPVLAVVLTHMS